MKAAGDRRLTNAKRLRRLTVGQPDQVDRDQRVAEVRPQGRDQCIELVRLDPWLGSDRAGVLEEVCLIRRARSAAPRRRTSLTDERVPQDSQR